MAEHVRVPIEVVEQMTVEERKAWFDANVITDPAEVTPSMQAMVERMAARHGVGQTQRSA